MNNFSPFIIPQYGIPETRKLQQETIADTLNLSTSNHKHIYL